MTPRQHERSSQLGFTLIELMIVVAIIGILASLAVYMFTRATNKARASEVPAVFAEFRIKQENFNLENGRYLSTNAGDSETPGFPDPMPSGDAIDISGSMPATWQQLKFNSDKSALYCSYSAVSGTSTDAPGTIANEFQFTTQPTQNYFYMLAFCDLDGNASVNSTYFARSSIDGQAVLRPGN